MKADWAQGERIVEEASQSFRVKADKTVGREEGERMDERGRNQIRARDVADADKYRSRLLCPALFRLEGGYAKEVGRRKVGELVVCRMDVLQVKANELHLRQGWCLSSGRCTNGRPGRLAIFSGLLWRPCTCSTAGVESIWRGRQRY